MEPTCGASGEPPLPEGATDEELLERVEDSRAMAEMNLQFGESESDANNAISQLEDALAHARRLTDPALAHEIASMLQEARGADSVQHSAEEAELEAAIKLSLAPDADAVEASDEVLLARALGLLDVANSHVGSDEDGNTRIERHEDATRALALLEQARSYSTRLRNPQREVMQSVEGAMGRVLLALSDWREREGRMDDSIQACERALVHFCAAEDKDYELRARRWLGMVFAKRGEHERAVEQIEQLRAIEGAQNTFLHKLSGREREVTRLGDLAEVHLTAGEVAPAAERLRQALEVCHEEDDRRHLIVALSDIMYKMGDLNAVVELSTSLMELTLASSSRTGCFSTEDVKALLLCAKALFSNGDRELGLERCEQLLALLRLLPGAKSSSSEAEVLLTLGILYHTDGQHERALSCLQAQLAIAAARNDARAKCDGHYNLACVCRSMHKDEQLISHCTQLLDILESLWLEVETDKSRLAYVTQFSAPSRMLVDALCRTGDVEQALEQTERGRSRALDLLLLRQRLHAPIGPGGAWRRRMIAKGGDGENAPNSLQTAGFAAGAGLDAMRELASIQRAAIVMLACVDLTDCADVLAWVVGSKGDLTFRRLKIPSEIGSLAQLVELARRSCKAPPRRSHASDGPQLDEKRLARDLAPFEDEEPSTVTTAPELCPPLRRCYQLLIEPLAATLANESRLLLLPDLQLYALPFAALQDSDGTYLIEKHMLTVAPSVATVLELDDRLRHSRRATPGRRSLVVGDPLLPPSLKLDPLPDAYAEAKKVHQLLEAHGRAATLLTRDEATKEAILGVIRTSDIVHLATHGRPDGVMLAGSSPRDGMLSMSEVQGLKLQSAPLIVLSACDSFCGELGTDGVVGVARSCLVSGATSLLAALWKVEDAATFELMGGFYSRLLAGGVESDMDVAAALQGAMIEMLRRGAHPGQWASFVAYGLQIGSKARVETLSYEASRRQR